MQNGEGTRQLEVAQPGTWTTERRDAFRERYAQVEYRDSIGDAVHHKHLALWASGQRHRTSNAAH